MLSSKNATVLLFGFVLLCKLFHNVDAACNPGTFVDGSDCSPCDGASYSTTTNAVSCSSADAGYGVNSDKTAQVECLAGYYRDSPLEICTKCDPGSAAAAAGSASCDACTEGKYAAACGATECSDCPAGTYSDVPSAAVCTQCQPPQFANVTGLTACFNCPVNTQFSAVDSNCEPCATGYYRAADMNALRCQPVLPGYGYVSGVVTICPAGFYQPSLGVWAPCVGCSPGTYASSAGSTVCTTCPFGKAAPNANTTVCQECPGGSSMSFVNFTCLTCPAGWFRAVNATEPCAKCNPGRAAPVQMSVNCTICPAGKFSSDLGATICSDCAPGTYSASPESTFCTPCLPGQFATAGSASCSYCPDGYYANTSGTCDLCGPGTYRAGSDVINECRPCPVGYASELDYGSSTCVECEAGQTVRQGSMGTCSDCPAGSHRSGDHCEPCSITSVAAAGSAECTECQNSTYPGPDRDTCVDCPPGYFRTEGTEELCSPCAPGSYETGGVCVLCPVGKYAFLAGSTACQNCPLYYFSNTVGAQACTACPQTTTTQTVGSTTCVPCPEDYTSYSGQACFPISQAPAVFEPGPEASSNERTLGTIITFIILVLVVLSIGLYFLSSYVCGKRTNFV